MKEEKEYREKCKILKKEELKNQRIEWDEKEWKKKNWRKADGIPRSAKAASPDTSNCRDKGGRPH